MSKLPAPAKFLRIGQLAARSGLSAKALRLYEARGLLQPDTHSDGGYRLYGPLALTRLNEIGVLKRAGFTLAEIGKLLQCKGSAAALVEARILALRREVHTKSCALAALERAWRGLDSASNDIHQLLESIRMNEKLDMRFTEADLAGFVRNIESFGKPFPPAERERATKRIGQLLRNSRITGVQFAKLVGFGKRLRKHLTPDDLHGLQTLADRMNRDSTLTQNITGQLTQWPNSLPKCALQWIRDCCLSTPPWLNWVAGGTPYS